MIAVGFTVSNDVWLAAVPSELRGDTLCLTCFARLADEKLIEWDRDIQFWPVSMARQVGLVNEGAVA